MKFKCNGLFCLNVLLLLLFIAVQFASKQMARSSKKCEKDEKTEKVKLKKVNLAIFVI